MINEHTYAIGMTVISWLIAVFMLTGFTMIKAFEMDLKSKNKSDIEKAQANIVLDKFYNADFAGKVVQLLHYGALFCVAVFRVIINGGKNK